MAESTDYGVETRSRSRSKTPQRLEGPSKAKMPLVRTIVEEGEETTVTTSTPTRTRAAKEARVVLTSISRQSVVTSTPSSAKKAESKKIVSAAESKQNEKNFLLETSIEAIKKSVASPNGSMTADNVAYKEYKDAGEYWNKTPKTDYTYSELSPHRREIAPNTIAMPNMSRGSLDKHQHRVNIMITRSPEQANYIRQRYAATTTTVKPRLEYDSGDETDLTEYTKYSKSEYNSNLQQHESRIRRLTRTITTFFTSIYITFTSMFTVSQRKEYLYYTRIEKPSIWRRAFQRVVDLWVAVLKRFYIVISTILTIDTWLLMSRSKKLMSERKRRFLILALFLLPLLILGGSLYYNDIDAQTIANAAKQSRDRLLENASNTYNLSRQLGKKYYDEAGIKLFEVWGATCLSFRAMGTAIGQLYQSSSDFAIKQVTQLRENVRPFLISE